MVLGFEDYYLSLKKILRS